MVMGVRMMMMMMTMMIHLLRGGLQPRSRLGLEGVEGDPDTSPGQEFPRRHSGSFHLLLLLLPLLLPMLLSPVYSQLLKFAP